MFVATCACHYRCIRRKSRPYLFFRPKIDQHSFAVPPVVFNFVGFNVQVASQYLWNSAHSANGLGRHGRRTQSAHGYRARGHLDSIKAAKCAKLAPHALRMATERNTYRDGDCRDRGPSPSPRQL